MISRSTMEWYHGSPGWFLLALHTPYMVIANGHGCCCRCVINVIKLYLACRGRHILLSNIPKYTQASTDTNRLPIMTKIVFARSGSPPKIIRNSKCFLHSSPSVGSFGVVLFVAGIHTPEQVHITIEDFCDLGLFYSSFSLFLVSSLGEISRC